jgi:hypothetical protein
MEIAEFCDKYPKLMHMANADAFASIREHGLLSTQAITELADIDEEDRRAILYSVRKTPTPAGKFLIRDQRPMNGKLKYVLDSDISTEQWLGLLNSKVFFWPRKKQPGLDDRLARFLKVYRQQPQLVLEFDSHRFMKQFAKDVSLSHINSGAIRDVRAKRGWKTFIPLAEYQWSYSNEVAEVIVPLRADNIIHCLERASILKPNGIETVLLSRGDNEDGHL